MIRWPAAFAARRTSWVSRTRIAARFLNVPPCLIGIEAGMASHHIARELAPRGRSIQKCHQ
jgi:hypothetical protein